MLPTPTSVKPSKPLNVLRQKEHTECEMGILLPATYDVAEFRREYDFADPNSPYATLQFKSERSRNCQEYTTLRDNLYGIQWSDLAKAVFHQNPEQVVACLAAGNSMTEKLTQRLKSGEELCELTLAHLLALDEFNMDCAKALHTHDPEAFQEMLLAKHFDKTPGDYSQTPLAMRYKHPHDSGLSEMFREINQARERRTQEAAQKKLLKELDERAGVWWNNAAQNVEHRQATESEWYNGKDNSCGDDFLALPRGTAQLMELAAATTGRPEAAATELVGKALKNLLVFESDTQKWYYWRKTQYEELRTKKVVLATLNGVVFNVLNYIRGRTLGKYSDATKCTNSNQYGRCVGCFKAQIWPARHHCERRGRGGCVRCACTLCKAITYSKRLGKTPLVDFLRRVCEWGADPIKDLVHAQPLLRWGGEVKANPISATDVLPCDGSPERPRHPDDCRPTASIQTGAAMTNEKNCAVQHGAETAFGRHGARVCELLVAAGVRNEPGDSELYVPWAEFRKEYIKLFAKTTQVDISRLFENQTSASNKELKELVRMQGLRIRQNCKLSQCRRYGYKKTTLIFGYTFSETTNTVYLQNTNNTPGKPRASTMTAMRSTAADLKEDNRVLRAELGATKRELEATKRKYESELEATKRKYESLLAETEQRKRVKMFLKSTIKKL